MSLDVHTFSVLAVAAFAFGCCVASFMNVCIWRIPRGESVAWPPSHCPKCNAPIRWYQNLPIVSWLALRGRCAACRAPISPRYIVVETLGGILFLGAFLQWAAPGWARTVPLDDPWMLAVHALVFGGLILGSGVDLAEFWIPDRVTVGGMLLGLPCSFAVCGLQGFTGHFRWEALVWSAGGLAFGFLFLWGIGFVFSKIFRKEALGFGDVKLFGAVGAFFGPVAVLFTLVVSSFIGAAYGLAMLVRARARLGGFTAIPYGPFIAAATVVWMFWGQRIVTWYLSFLCE